MPCRFSTFRFDKTGINDNTVWRVIYKSSWYIRNLVPKIQYWYWIWSKINESEQKSSQKCNTFIHVCVCGMCGLTFTAILNVPSKTLDWLLGWILGTKLFSPELHKCYFLYVHKQIRSKVPILLYFVGPKRPSSNYYVSCFLIDKTALRWIEILRHANKKLAW